MTAGGSRRILAARPIGLRGLLLLIIVLILLSPIIAIAWGTRALWVDVLVALVAVVVRRCARSSCSDRLLDVVVTRRHARASGVRRLVGSSCRKISFGRGGAWGACAGVFRLCRGI